MDKIKARHFQITISIASSIQQVGAGFVLGSVPPLPNVRKKAHTTGIKKTHQISPSLVITSLSLVCQYSTPILTRAVLQFLCSVQLLQESNI